MESYAYIYLLQDSDDKGTDIFKLGRTIQQKSDTRVLCRITSYSPGTIVYNIFMVPVDKVNEIENEIIEVFKTKYTLARGCEWFRGNVYSMKKDIDIIVDAYNNNIQISMMNNDNVASESEDSASEDDSRGSDQDDTLDVHNPSNYKEHNLTYLTLVQKIKLCTQVPDEFVDDFIPLYDPINPSQYIDLDQVAKWLSSRKYALLTTLRDSYKHGVDFKELPKHKFELVKNRPRGGNLHITVLLTLDCTKRLCMRSNAKHAETILNYFIEIEQLMLYGNSLCCRYNRLPNSGRLFIIRNAHIPRRCILERLAFYNTGRKDDVTVVAVYETQYRKEVERCVKELVKEKQYKKRREIYEVDHEIIQKVITGCMKLSMKLHHKSRRDNPADGQYYMIFTSDIPGRTPV